MADDGSAWMAKRLKNACDSTQAISKWQQNDAIKNLSC